MHCRGAALIRPVLILASLCLALSTARAKDQVRVEEGSSTNTITRWTAKGTTFIQDRTDYGEPGQRRMGTARYAFQPGSGKAVRVSRWLGDHSQRKSWTLRNGVVVEREDWQVPPTGKGAAGSNTATYGKRHVREQGKNSAGNSWDHKQWQLKPGVVAGVETWVDAAGTKSHMRYILSGDLRQPNVQGNVRRLEAILDQAPAAPQPLQTR